MAYRHERVLHRITLHWSQQLSDHIAHCGVQPSPGQQPLAKTNDLLTQPQHRAAPMRSCCVQLNSTSMQKQSGNITDAH